MSPHKSSSWIWCVGIRVLPWNSPRAEPRPDVEALKKVTWPLSPTPPSNMPSLIPRSAGCDPFLTVPVYKYTINQAYSALHETLHEVQNVKEKNIFFGTKVTSEAFLGLSQHLKVTRLQGGTQTKLWTCWRNFDIFHGHLNVFFFWGPFMALLCSSRRSGQKCYKTECVALETSFQTRPLLILAFYIIFSLYYIYIYLAI